MAQKDVKYPSSYSYLWIIRNVGDKLNRSSEYKMIDEAPASATKPLLEVINESTLPQFYAKLNGKYGEVWVDLPYYLSERENPYKPLVDVLIKKYNTKPENFFKNNKKHIDVPVVSAKSIYAVPYSYSDENAIYEAIKTDFNKVAVRIRVPQIDYTASTSLKSSFDKLVASMRKTDVLLLDVFGFTDAEVITCKNIMEMSKVAKGKEVKVFILNAFDTHIENCHNFSPLLSKKYLLEGFGDFATEERFKGVGGRGSDTRKIRYYIPSNYKLWFVVEKSSSHYAGAKSRLMASPNWKNTSDAPHQRRCIVCDEVDKGNNNADHVYWKRFKILHYLHCISHEGVLNYSSYDLTDDLDPDGNDALVKLGVV